MMTTFQIILAVAGVLLIAGVLIYNVIQERRFRKEADRMFAYKQDDIMLGESVHAAPSARNDSSRIQLDPSPAPLDTLDIPSLELPDQVSALEDTVVMKAPEPPAARPESPKPPAPQPVRPPPAPAKASAPPLPDIQPDRPSPLDPDTEYVARLRLAPAAGANFAPLLASLRRIGKPVRAFGYRPGGDWETLATGAGRGGSFAMVEIGLQLVDRSGALTGEQIDAFCRALYGYTAEEGGAVTCPDKEAPLQAARDLDLFCMDVDVLIGLNVVSGDARPFTGEAIHQIVREAGLSLEGGAYQARDAGGKALFTLTNQDEEPIPAEGRGLTTHGVTLLFDVPRVADGLAVFDRMTQLGYDLAARLDGRLVDDNGRQVGDDSLNRDRARLSEFFLRMQQRGIPAGSERALRLFV